MKVEAQVVLTKCRRNQLYGVRMEKRRGDWCATWAFEMNEKKAVSEGYAGVTMSGSFTPLDSYPGCPYCKTRELLLCPECGKLSCYREGETTISCQWCGFSGTVEHQERVDLQGTGM